MRSAFQIKPPLFPALQITPPFFLPTNLSAYRPICLSRYICLPTYLPIHLPTDTCVYRCICLPTYDLFAYRRKYLYRRKYAPTYSGICVPTCIPTDISAYRCKYLPTYLLPDLYTLLSVYRPICLPTYLPTDRPCPTCPPRRVRRRRLISRYRENLSVP